MENQRVHYGSKNIGPMTGVQSRSPSPGDWSVAEVGSLLHKCSDGERPIRFSIVLRLIGVIRSG